MEERENQTIITLDINKAKEVLGQEADKYSENELQQLVDSANGLTEIFFQQFYTKIGGDKSA